MSRLESKEKSKDEMSKFGTSAEKKVTPSPYAAAPRKPRKLKDGPDICASSDGSDSKRGDVSKAKLPPERNQRLASPTNDPRSESKGRWEETSHKVRDNKPFAKICSTKSFDPICCK